MSKATGPATKPSDTDSLVDLPRHDAKAERAAKSYQTAAPFPHTEADPL